MTLTAARDSDARHRLVVSAGIAGVLNLLALVALSPLLRAEADAADGDWQGLPWKVDTAFTIEPDSQVREQETLSFSFTNPAPQEDSPDDTGNLIAGTNHVAPQQTINPLDFNGPERDGAPPAVASLDEPQPTAADRQPRPTHRRRRPSPPEPTEAQDPTQPPPEAITEPSESEADEGLTESDELDLSLFRPTLGNTSDLLFQDHDGDPSTPPHPVGRQPVRSFGSRDPDVLRVEEGDRTDLTTTRSSYYGWSRRYVLAVERNWHPGRVHRMHDPTGALYGDDDRVTFVDALYNADGQPISVEVVRSSGLYFLDEEAVRALRLTPLPGNVPEGLRNANGEVRQHWRFTLTFSRGIPQFRANWLNDL